MESLTLAQMRAAASSGGIKSVNLKAEGGAFVVTATTHSGGRATLITERRTGPRRFSDPRKLFTLLQSMGIVVGTFDAMDWDPSQRDESKARVAHTRKHLPNQPAKVRTRGNA